MLEYKQMHSTHTYCVKKSIFFKYTEAFLSLQSMYKIDVAHFLHYLE